MIEICLDPDDDSALSSEAFNDDDDAEYHDSRTMALKTAQRLLLVFYFSSNFINSLFSFFAQYDYEIEIMKTA